ncbi:hypothetical protein F4560_006685 [Saccharothrix ecbatanensis]|uniref:Uncharacterized protein n=1 Tax=Saccharothrix ecbatanensis TaxID=1105145 RepID=A0A7W9HR33_9PSEU|nr:hypothetical protein [Saccharothrix ecbatanensis]MBB5806917.1 hypothetical protein [Saccharothrix ecbatanensis]
MRERGHAGVAVPVAVPVAVCRWRCGGGGVAVAVWRWRCGGGGVAVAVAVAVCQWLGRSKRSSRRALAVGWAAGGVRG